MRNAKFADRCHLILWLSSIFLLFFRPTWAWTLYGKFDDACYFYRLLDWLGMAHADCGSRSFLPGASLAWLPAALGGTIFARLFGGDRITWLLMAVGSAGYLFWGGSLFLLAALRDRQRPELPLGWVVLFLLSAPALYYAVCRTTVAHAAELFFSALTVLMVYRGRLWAAAGAGAFLTLVRLNDLPVLLFCLAAFGEKRSSASAANPALKFFFAVAVVVGFRWAILDGYNATYLHSLVDEMRYPDFRALLLGDDWGLIWTAPAWLLTLVLGTYRACRRPGEVTAKFGALLFWMWANFLLCLAWGGNGSDFGYRYLIGSYPAAFAVWLEISPALSPRWDRATRWTVGVNAAWMTALTWFYKSESLFWPYLSPSGRWLLPQFQPHVLERLLSFRDGGKPFAFSAAGVAWALAHGDRLTTISELPRYLPFPLTPQTTAACLAAALVGVIALLAAAATALVHRLST